MNKYNAKKTELCGRMFDSKREANRAFELELMEKLGQISNLIFQPRFVVWTPKDPRVRPIVYVGDFFYIRGGLQICEDAKGVRTEVYKMKIKMARDRYPDVQFKEV